MTVEEYHVAQLWTVIEASKDETGGGEGVEILVNEPFSPDSQYAPPKALPGGEAHSRGQYTHKNYHLASKVPGFIRVLAPAQSLSVKEVAWNAFPYCRTVITVSLRASYISLRSCESHQFVDSFRMATWRITSF